MTIAQKLNRYLTDHRAEYEIIAHMPTRSSIETARICHVPARQMVKAVLLDTDQDYLLAVLPANRRLELGELSSGLGPNPHLVDEEELAIIFDDCAVGAIPALASGYGVKTMVDDSLDDQADVYFEAGDHASLIHMSGAEFSRLTEQTQRGHFSNASSPMH